MDQISGIKKLPPLKICFVFPDNRFKKVPIAPLLSDKAPCIKLSTDEPTSLDIAPASAPVRPDTTSNSLAKPSSFSVKDSNIGKEGITLTGGRYANIIGCHFNGRRCVALREDFGSGFNGTIRLKNCDGSLSQGEIIYLKSNTDFDYGYTWKAPSIEIEDCDFTTSAGRLDILATTIPSSSRVTGFG